MYGSRLERRIPKTPFGHKLSFDELSFDELRQCAAAAGRGRGAEERVDEDRAPRD